MAMTSSCKQAADMSQHMSAVEAASSAQPAARHATHRVDTCSVPASAILALGLQSAVRRMFGLCTPDASIMHLPGVRV